MTYHVATHVSVPSLKRERTIDRSVTVRTRDDLAILQDLPKGRNQLFHGFPVTPTFDALSYFTLQWFASAHLAITSYVRDVHPLTYAAPSPSAKADVVVVNLRYYHASYATDSSDSPSGQTHLSLHPYDFLTRNASKSVLYFNDLFIDNATGLPSRVRFIGPNDRSFTVDYAMIEQHWLITHAQYQETLFGPLRVGAMHIVAEANYDGFTFPTAPPDPRLAPP